MEAIEKNVMEIHTGKLTVQMCFDYDTKSTAPFVDIFH